MTDIPKPWARQTLSKEQELDPSLIAEPLDTLYRAIGRAITVFASVEYSLGFLFTCIVKANRYAAWKMFNAPESFSTKLGIIKTYGEALYLKRLKKGTEKDLNTAKWEYLEKLLGLRRKVWVKDDHFLLNAVEACK
jgi:hypothetical protein